MLLRLTENTIDLRLSAADARLLEEAFDLATRDHRYVPLDSHKWQAMMYANELLCICAVLAERGYDSGEDFIPR